MHLLDRLEIALHHTPRSQHFLLLNKPIINQASFSLLKFLGTHFLPISHQAYRLLWTGLGQLVSVLPDLYKLCQSSGMAMKIRRINSQYIKDFARGLPTVK